VESNNESDLIYHFLNLNFSTIIYFFSFREENQHMDKKLTVIDFFCGAGGFSEGFRQAGFKIIKGYDNWGPAIETHNHNFGTTSEVKNILDFKDSIEEIEELPDTDIILGSPPCVSFSSSNKSGKADKSLGVELTETFLRIVAIKKHQPKSILKAWFMENVINSKRYLQPSYTFRDLNLTEWAREKRISPNKIAINLYDNTANINSADYGAYQARKRLIAGEIVSKKGFIIPKITHGNSNTDNLLPYNTIGKIKENFPTPYEAKSAKIIKDVQYDIRVPLYKITDHFYDTGIYKSEWRFSKHWKINHPFMGKMSFPENENKPSRTITATKIANSRESIIYKSEIKRIGDGEYRLPTVREAAIIMGFPISYQFIGSEGSKWRLVGNAVCCSVSRALANSTLLELGLDRDKPTILRKEPKLYDVPNLNTFKLKSFDKPPIKKKGSRFRWHAIKDGNMTVTLSNYDIEKNSKVDGVWRTSIQYGTGKGFPIQQIPPYYYKKMEPILENLKGGKKFIEVINNGFSEKIGSHEMLQKMYEHQESIGKFQEPTLLVEEIKSIIKKLGISDTEFNQKNYQIFKFKEIVPLNQLCALYAINKITTVTNNL
jgi:DNA (cytosine-5)-methyltransferase 1